MDGLDNLRVASFSAYLNPEDQESFALKLAAVVQEAVPAIMSPLETPRAVSFRRPRSEKEGEIGIFGADKYFNVKMENKLQNPIEGRMQPSYRNDHSFSKKELVKPRLSEVATSACTESSWNSQVELLPPRDHGNSSRTNKPKRTNGRRGNFFKGFGCRGPCRGSREESKQMVSDSPKNPTSGLKSQDQFAFPILNVKNGHNNPDLSKKLCDEPRNSIEVFGSQIVKKGDEMNQMIAKNLERKLSMLTWDAIPKKSHRNIPTTKTTIGPVEEALSDASSDLFEIETLSGVGLPYLNVPPTADDASGCMTPTTLYEPSEVSIEWSVMTASVVNDFSFASDFDDRSTTGDLNLISGSKNSIGKEGHKNKGSSGFLVGCKSQKAVSVVQNNLV